VVAGVDAEVIADIAHVTSTDLAVTPTARKALERRTRVRQTRRVAMKVPGTVDHHVKAVADVVED